MLSRESELTDLGKLLLRIEEVFPGAYIAIEARLRDLRPEIAEELEERVHSE